MCSLHQKLYSRSKWFLPRSHSKREFLSDLKVETPRDGGDARPGCWDLKVTASPGEFEFLG
jgi:hypothetical protein